MGLIERIEIAGRREQRRMTDVAPLVERRAAERRQPRWLERKQEQGLPAKDYTSQVAA